ncbi:NAD-dependent epimerase/dehydratase family protein [Blastopirellula marina]|uniref:NAD-dependent epimerase/dehydratase domain-containing protein n=1 Tax=Blastopirellula marina TaxID=124 RepID=A0A2S8GU60_9BACT|nr:NAD-dependent epimerase/dehydratase family protein [Blastopirellula marina]PQO47975.1 hypothetical protein C5Y93_00890 [Blastopirellula marina]
MAKYFVTGGSGFVGRHLCRRLAADGHSLRCAVRKTSDTDHLKDLDAELVELDLAHSGDDLEQAIDGCDAVYHVAGLTRATSPDQLYSVNRDGTQRLCEAAAAQADPPPILYVSSLAAVGPARQGNPKRTEDFPKPISNYGRSKRAGERQAELVADRVPITIVRPGIVFGEENREMLPMFQPIRHFAVHPMPGGDLRVSLIYISDLIDLLLKAMADGKRISHREDPQSKFDGVGYYFAADQHQPNYEELGEMLAEAVGVDNLHSLSLPKPILWTSATLSELTGRALGQAYVFNLDKIREATAGSWICDVSHTREELGFEPSQSLESRLQQTADWYRDAGWL